MKVILLAVCGALTAIRHPRTTPRQLDKVRLGALLCAAAVAIQLAGPLLGMGDGAEAAARVTGMTLFLISMWCAHDAIMEAVRHSRHRACSDQGKALLFIACLLCWLGLALGVSGCMPDGTVAGLSLAIGHLYIGGACAEVAIAAWLAARIAHTGGVRAGTTVLGVSTAALSAIALFRVAVFLLFISGATDSETAVACQQIGSAGMTVAGTFAVIGLSMPAFAVLRPWLFDAAWALRCLRRIRPIWSRAASDGKALAPGTWSVSRTDPVARLHRRVVEIRDAELSQIINLRTRETAMIESIEEKLTRGPGTESRKAA